VPSARQRSNVGVEGDSAGRSRAGEEDRRAERERSCAARRVPEPREDRVARDQDRGADRPAALDERAVVGDPHERLLERVDLVSVREPHDVADRAVPEELRERELARPARRLEVRHGADVRMVDPACVRRQVAPAHLRHVVGVEGDSAGRSRAGEEDRRAERERSCAARPECEACGEQREHGDRSGERERAVVVPDPLLDPVEGEQER